MRKYTAQSGIYVILNTKNSKVYIGQSVDIYTRWRKHEEALNRGKHQNRHLQNAWNKYGEKFFRFQILEHCSIDKLDEREQHYLDIYIPKGICYNIATNVEVPARGRHPSIESRHRMSISQKGRVTSKESRLKISLAHRGRKFSDEHRRKLSEAAKQRTVISDETRNKLSQSRMGSKNHNFGKHLSETHRQKLSKAAKGNKRSLGIVRSAETKQKLKDTKREKYGVKTVWNGIEYNSVAECAEANEVSQSTMRHRLRKGYRSINDMLKSPRVGKR